MVYSKIDQVYRSLLLTKFFTKGWGKPDNLKRIFEFRKILSHRESCQALVGKDYPILIDKDYRDGDCRILEGHFQSPFVHHMPGIMPKEVETATFQAVLPLKWQHATLKPICIHLAGTGDHFFWRRRVFTARPLLKNAGIASILLENPYYGSRKPKTQMRSSLHNVSDLFVMGAGLILESLALLHWCERMGWGPLGLSGVSMGGHMASLAATNWEKPIALVPLLSWSTASCVFTQGVMSGAIPWQVLQEQFFKNNLYHDEISKLIVSPEKAYQLGQDFVINYTKELDKSGADEQASVAYNAQTATPSDEEMSDPPDLDLQPSPVTSQVISEETTVSRNTNSYGENAHKVIFTATRSSADPISSSASSPPLNGTAAPSLAVAAFTTVTSGSSVPLNENENAQSFSSMDNNNTDSQKNQKTKPSRDELRTRLTLNYARSKQSQQSPDAGTSKDKKRLTLGHAVEKSKILFSRNKSERDDRMKKGKNLQEESFEFMRGVMDECTHLGNFCVPVDPELVIIVSAIQDAYIPRDGVLPLDKLWPGSEVRYVDKGHIGAVLFHQSVFRKAVKDAFDKQIKKYYPGQQLGTGKPPRKRGHL